MKVFKFFSKEHIGIRRIYFCIGVIFGLFVIVGSDNSIGEELASYNKDIAYLLVSILSLISAVLSAKQASKEFEEIIIEGESVKFVFFHKMKNHLLVKKSEMSVVVNEAFIEMKRVSSGELIGIVYKDRIKEGSVWEDLIDCFSGQIVE